MKSNLLNGCEYKGVCKVSPVGERRLSAFLSSILLPMSCFSCYYFLRGMEVLSSPGPKTQKLKNQKPRGLGLTLKQYSKNKNVSQWSPLLVQQKKSQVDSERKDIEQSNMFSENIINLTCCIIIKMPAFRVDKFSAGRTKCRSPMLKRTWWKVQHCS